MLFEPPTGAIFWPPSLYVSVMHWYIDGSSDLWCPIKSVKKFNRENGYFKLSVRGVDRKCNCENIILFSGSPWPVHWSKVDRSIGRKRDKISWFPLNVLAYKSSLSASNRRDIHGILVSSYYTVKIAIFVVKMATAYLPLVIRRFWGLNS